MAKNEKLIEWIRQLNEMIVSVDTHAKNLRAIRDGLLAKVEANADITSEEAMRAIMTSCEGTVGDGHAGTYDGDDRDQT